ncbi:MAG: hypothetical protein HOK30_17585 [Rhodospirillaceae bacterium]|nr:hypothetical protein [Rhodospirillaceae bacterium]MBT5194909.1 hypothetical protein [Rhodospirillaceae bacterium]MBT5895550.1 hypothetical protein [Rhodospirillaceae bacterium]MBT6429483.1 hypothetical protein [Rhodospirillaceae bacterium]MBT7758605.1 hypothetical protein [Rhodospirillaceae bacterium]
MSAPSDALLLDFVEWIAAKPRPYDDVMAAWRTSCPRLTIWEDAVGQNLVKRERLGKGDPMVRITHSGCDLLSAAGRMPAAAL